MNFGEDLSLQVMLACKSFQQRLNRAFHNNLFHHYQLLLALYRLGGQTTQRQLCEELLIEKSHMAAIIEKLTAKGYITREQNIADRRSKMIKLTPEAHGHIKHLRNVFERLEEEITGDLTWQEMNNCLRVLNKVNHRFKEMGDEKADTF